MKLESQKRYVFLDTEVFIKNNFNFSFSHLYKIINLANEEKLSLIITDVTISEIENHIKEEVEQSNHAVKNLHKKGKILRNCNDPSFKNIFEFDHQIIQLHLLNQLREFLRNSKAIIINTDDVSVKEIFRKYFTFTPPFSKGKKKYEFPDAFAFGALEKWCAEKNEELVIVSGDPDWEDASKLNKSFTYFDKIQEVLDLIYKENKLTEVANKFLKEHESEIYKSAKEQFLI